MKITKELEEKLLQAYNDYIVYEFEDEELDSLPADGVLGLAYTTYDFEKEEDVDLQVSYNLKTQQYFYQVNGVTVRYENRTVEELIEDLESCDFSGFISDILDDAIELYGETI